MIEYLTVEVKKDKVEFQETIEEFLNDGWELQGNLVVAYNQRFEYLTYIQAVIRQTKNIQAELSEIGEK
jgi:hypothetical protein